MLDIRLSLLTWKAAFQHIKQWAYQQGFFVRKERSEKVFEYLEKCKNDDLYWSIYKDWDYETNTLTKLFWMNPNQLEAWYQYSDVILNDNTSKTNRYDMSLSFFVAVDNNLKSQIVAQVLMDRETKDAYSWILQCILDTTGLMPKVFVIDADPGMDVAIRLKYSSTFAIHCIWHIGQNLPLRLKSKLGGSFNQFKNDFYECRNSLEQKIFEKLDVFLAIEERNVIDELKEFTTQPIQKIHYNEMELAFSYDAKLLDQSYIIKEDLQDWSFSSDFIEKQETRQIIFQRLLSSCSETTVKCLWEVSYLTSSKVHHLVILLNNGTYKCSCISPATRGIICRYYFSIMLQTPEAQFHIGFLNQRWLISNHSHIKN
ncbi:hypothetical protein RclHR1_10970006 [Rhizophagus clarus]|uniref:MULE transposase domain-containing protein n=1 Tax=Rhizophagus clarus TaxID=94130 RepID=A0A2Z6Q4I2_9GLOM|nr:hypothetical protein RclHR1_10970006 [Rhizophagus clarus]